MSASDLPKPIQNMMLKEANEDDKYEPMPNSYHITELIGCLRKAYLKRTQSKKPIDLEQANHFHCGRLWDKDFCKCFKHNQVRVTYRCQNVPISISGHFDFLNQDDPANPVITDLKVPNPKSFYFLERDGCPSERYRKQVLFYCYCAAISKGAIMYWSGRKPLTFPVEVSDKTCKELISELEGSVLVLWSALRNGRMPSRDDAGVESWECRLCEYKTECEAKQ
jgi:hypothetical protein